MTLDLDAIKARLEGVTEGPWIEGQDGNARVYGPDGKAEHSGLVAVVYKGRANTRFIAAARSDIPALVAEVERLRAVLEDQAAWGCTCDPAYHERQLSAPDCMADLVGDDVREALGRSPVCKGRIARAAPKGTAND
jgi:hypothetical protein